MAIDIQNVTAVQNQQQGGIIGHLCWYSIREHLITPDDLRNKLMDSGLDESWMPPEIRVPDAFRRATKEVEQRKKADAANVYFNFLVRDVFSDKDHVQRNIVIEKADKQGKRLDYNSKAAVMLLDKKTATMSSQVFDPKVTNLTKEAESSFKLYKHNYSAQTIRSMAMNILKSMSPTPVRPNGGVYFVPSAHTDQLGKWVRFLNSLDRGEGFKVPLVNTLDNRQMVSKKLKEHLFHVIEECQYAMKGDLKKGQVKEIIDNAKRVIGGFNQYRNLVKNDIEQFESYIDTIRQQVSLIIDEM